MITEEVRSKYNGADSLKNYSGTKRDYAIAILEIINIAAPDQDLHNVEAGSNFRDQLEMDSMDFLDVVMELRKQHKIEVPKEEYTKLATLEASIEYLSPKFEAIYQQI
jgi:acyl carrier protein